MTDFTIGEKRFREGSGARYLLDGTTIRCQGLSKTRVRVLKAKNNDSGSDSSIYWPEAQCPKPAVEGKFMCRFHGGLTPSAQPKTILDILPYDLGQKFKIAAENPGYLNRQQDINLMQARIYQLLEKLDEDEGGEAAWDYVGNALDELKKGNILSAETLLSSALSMSRTEREVWSEIRANESVIKDLTNTQMKTAKELHQMATTEQVTAMLLGIQNLIFRAMERYIEDAGKRVEVTQYIAAGITRLSNVSATTPSYESVEESGAADRETF